MLVVVCLKCDSTRMEMQVQCCSPRASKFAAVNNPSGVATCLPNAGWPVDASGTLLRLDAEAGDSIRPAIAEMSSELD